MADLVTSKGWLQKTYRSLFLNQFIMCKNGNVKTVPACKSSYWCLSSEGCVHEMVHTWHVINCVDFSSLISLALGPRAQEEKQKCVSYWVMAVSKNRDWINVSFTNMFNPVNMRMEWNQPPSRKNDWMDCGIIRVCVCEQDLGINTVTICWQQRPLENILLVAYCKGNVTCHWGNCTFELCHISACLSVAWRRWTAC